MNIRTLGRRPTLGEVLDYYTRDRFLRFLLDTCRVRRVAMVIPEKLHWEPNWSEDEVNAGDVERLGQYIVSKISESLPDVRLGDRPSYYPSFHQSVWKWQDGADRPARERNTSSKPKMRDCIFEADLLTWRDSFRDVYAIVDLMDRHDVCYRHKFSGHRSLHVVIPAEALPKGYRGKGARKLASRLFKWSGSQAHLLPKITRVPYSLNEDTGLVCLPIERGALPRFRPWQANVHLVEMDDPWDEHITADDRAKMEAFVNALEALESGDGPSGDPTSTVFFFSDRRRITSEYRERLAGFQGEGAIGNTWRLLASDHKVSEHTLMEGLACSEPDAKWFTVEAFFLNGTSLSREGFLKLLEQEEEYVRPAAVDVLLRLQTDVFPHLVQMIGDLDHLPTVGSKVTYLLTQSDSLRDKVIEAIVQRTDRSREALITCTCLAGSMTGNWTSAFGLLGTVRNATDLSEQDKAKLAALDLMSTMGGWNKKEQAIKSQTLADLGRDVTDLLLIAAGSPNRRFRRGIVSALATLADERTVDLLVRSLADDYSRVRRKAIAGLVRIGEKAVDPLIEATASDQTLVRRYAVFCLGRIGAQRAKPTLLQALDDGQQEVRQQAIKGLKKVATVDDIERLKQVLREETWENAMLAIEAMEAIGEEGKEPMLEMALRERNSAAAYSIALHGDPRGREILVEQLSEGDEKREDAAELLRELGDERCIPFFAGKLKTEATWRGMFVAQELGRIGGREAIAALIEALGVDNRLTRRGAVRALGEVKDPTAIEPLIRCLEDEDSKVRGLAATALAEMGEAVRDPLKRALEEDRIQGKQPRNVAKRVLWKLDA